METCLPEEKPGEQEKARGGAGVGQPAGGISQAGWPLRQMIARGAPGVVPGRPVTASAPPPVAGPFQAYGAPVAAPCRKALSANEEQSNRVRWHRAKFEPKRFEPPAWRKQFAPNLAGLSGLRASGRSKSRECK